DDVLVVRNVDAGDTGHRLTPVTLSISMGWRLASQAHEPLAPACRPPKKGRQAYTQTLQKSSSAQPGASQPCLCLWRGSEQMTRTTPLRLMILHLRQTRFTDALTFIFSLLASYVRPHANPVPVSCRVQRRNE